MEAIQFLSIPLSLRDDGVYIENDSSRALKAVGTALGVLLLVGQMLGSNAAAGTPISVTRESDATFLFGRGSMLEAMFKTVQRQDSLLPVICLPLADNGAGVQATGTLTITGPATGPGTLNVYVGGERVQVGVATGDTAATIATAVAAAVNANGDLPVTAAASTATVTFTARHRGELGNDIEITVNDLGILGGEVFPSGVGTSTTTPFYLTGGSANPTLGSVTSLPEELYDYWVNPYTDTTSMGVVEAELLDRWGYDKALEATAYGARRGTVSQLSTWGAARNNPFISVMGYNGSPSPSYLWSAAYGARAAATASVHPASPIKGPLLGIRPPRRTSLFTRAERNILLYDGVATYGVTPDGTVRAGRTITTYQTNLAGAPDTSFLDMETANSLKHVRQTLRTWLMLQLDGFGLVGDNDQIRAGQRVINPRGIKDVIMVWAGQMADFGLIEDLAAFERALIVVRSQFDPNRVDILIRPDFVNQLRILAIQAAFIK